MILSKELLWLMSIVGGTPSDRNRTLGKHFSKHIYLIQEHPISSHMTNLSLYTDSITVGPCHMVKVKPHETKRFKVCALENKPRKFKLFSPLRQPQIKILLSPTTKVYQFVET